MTRMRLSLSAVILLGSGCFDEGLVIEDLAGTVRVPVEAATRVVEVEDASGNLVEEEITDVGFIGPVYVGVFDGIDFESDRFPLPNRGPDISRGDTLPGASYPYDGTSIGDFNNACMEFFTCRFVSGRFATFQDIVDWYNNVLRTPVIDSLGQTVFSGEYIRQTCYEILEYTEDDEIRATAPDRNDDGVIDAEDLDFVLDDSGEFFVGEFKLRQSEFFAGQTVWAYMDAPTASGRFDSCNDTEGYFETTYNRNYQTGIPQPDLLNYPANYIAEGDWVVSEGYEWVDPYAEPALTLDFEVGVTDINDIRPGQPEEEE